MKQGAVSHFSSEAEIIASEAALSTEGISSLMPWDLVMEVFQEITSSKPSGNRREIRRPIMKKRLNIHRYLSNVDEAPANMSEPNHASEILSWKTARQ